MAGIPSSLRELFYSFSDGNGISNEALADTSEQAGVPMEVMGLMLGEIVDEYTIRIVDVFAMPQSGNSVSVEAVDPVYQTNMLEELKKTGRHEMVVGWYHSHPGFGCWLSGTDVNTQKSFEQLNPRTIGVVVDPIQSVKGKVVIDCFRLINPHILMLGQEPRQTTSNIGYLTKPTLTALVHGLNRNYYSIVINYRKNELEKNMLLNLHKDIWANPLKLLDFNEQKKNTDETLESIKKLTSLYNKNLRNEMKKTNEEILLENIGKIDAKKRIQNCVETLLNDSILTCIGKDTTQRLLLIFAFFYNCHATPHWRKTPTIPLVCTYPHGENAPVGNSIWGIPYGEFPMANTVRACKHLILDETPFYMMNYFSSGTMANTLFF
ncbi:26S proteasome regulatory subunit RPN11, putative (RPN11) [Plasmodium ovale wallikeri]|uniref:26S proteasome regulatory subunit RPN11, putative (RPN11) n=1 Tax=Plasmodium ovale wallikeri TaxID=864142 RepID=A0A1A8Z0M5_PLAOA|nr:26S proteasome regulatory subunit RPN11, putative (RPN11) [Plasmodium ovale wallikeri]